MDAEDGENVGDVAFQINVYNLITMEKPPHGIDWVEDKFYEPWFYAKFLVEQNIRLHELWNNRITTPPLQPKS